MDPQFDLRDLDAIPDPLGPVSTTAAPPLPAMTASPTRAQTRRRRLMLLGAAIAFEAMFVAMMGVRSDLSQVPLGVVGVAVFGPLAAAIAALFVAIRRDARSVGTASSSIAFALGAAVCAYAVAAASSAHGGVTLEGHALRDATMMCFAGSAMITAVPLVLGLVAFRYAFVSSARWRGAALGCAAGAVAACAMAVRCPIDGVMHVLLGHGAFVVIGGVLGYALGRRTQA